VNARKVEARAARGQTEHALDRAGWPWSLRLSRWIDALVVLEEQRLDDLRADLA
jgi:hypothetical protein